MKPNGRMFITADHLFRVNRKSEPISKRLIPETNLVYTPNSLFFQSVYHHFHQTTAQSTLFTDITWKHVVKRQITLWASLWLVEEENMMSLFPSFLIGIMLILTSWRALHTSQQEAHFVRKVFPYLSFTMSYRVIRLKGAKCTFVAEPTKHSFLSNTTISYIYFSSSYLLATNKAFIWFHVPNTYMPTKKKL